MTDRILIALDKQCQRLTKLYDNRLCPDHLYFPMMEELVAKQEERRRKAA